MRRPRIRIWSRIRGLAQARRGPARAAFACGVLALMIAVGAVPSEAKKFRYASGPKVPEDTMFSVGQLEIEPVRERGPRMAPTNLQVVSLVANEAFARAMADMPVAKGGAVVLAPSESHPLNFVAEHAVLRELSKRGIAAQVRREMVADDSLAIVADSLPVLDYQLATARVTYVRLRGWLPGRVRVQRQGLVEGRLTLRDPRHARLLWTGDASWNLVDVFPKGQLAQVEDERFTDLKATVPERNLSKVFEPVLVIAVVAGLVVLFFQNKP